MDFELGWFEGWVGSITTSGSPLCHLQVLSKVQERFEVLGESVVAYFLWSKKRIKHLWNPMNHNIIHIYPHLRNDLHKLSTKSYECDVVMSSGRLKVFTSISVSVKWVTEVLKHLKHSCVCNYSEKSDSFWPSYHFGERLELMILALMTGIRWRCTNARWAYLRCPSPLTRPLISMLKAGDDTAQIRGGDGSGRW